MSPPSRGVHDITADVVKALGDALPSCAVGTANFDNRSFRLNFEITVIAADATLGREVERMFEADFARSRLMETGEVEAKSRLFRLGVRIARLAAPVL